MLRSLGWILAAVLIVPMGEPDKDGRTIAELEQLLRSYQAANRSDHELATELKDFHLGEQLTQGEVSRITSMIPGPLSTEQIYVLQGRTAWLAPPPSDLPAPAPPDSAAQQQILNRVVEYINGTYLQIPQVWGHKSISRFQDGPGNMQIVDSGATTRMAENSVRMFDTSTPYMRFIESHEVALENLRGVEERVSPPEKITWGPNGRISEGGPVPPLNSIVIDGVLGGKLAWARWEAVDGKNAAVFSFSVEKKKSRYKVEYCCFPSTESVGTMNNLMDDVNFQTATHWKPFKSTTGYHGELFVDAESGVVLRLTSHAELKPSDFVHQEDLRIDYVPVKLGEKTFFLPGTMYQWTEVVPFGDSFARRFAVRHTLLTSTYKDYGVAAVP